MSHRAATLPLRQGEYHEVWRGYDTKQHPQSTSVIVRTGSNEKTSYPLPLRVLPLSQGEKVYA